MTESLKSKTILGIIWSAVNRFGTMIISFVSTMVLARLLLPEDFGCIGMLMVFIAIADTLVDGGFPSALIQKQHPTNIDYSSVFYFQLLLALFLYVVLFVSAPAIATFYNIEGLCTMLRVLGILPIISAFSIVQNNQLQKQLNFKRLAMIDLISTAIGTLISIFLALSGFGVWSLVAKTILNSSFRSLLYWLLSQWRPLKIFSLASFKELFSFGGLLLFANITETIVDQLVSLIIGRSYSADALGYYVQALNLQHFPQTTIPVIINQVFFPVFSSIQDDIEKVVVVLKSSLKALTFVVFPLMIILMVIAKPLIIVLFTDKWLKSVPYFQLLCFVGMVYPVNSNNVNILKALRRGKDILYLSFVKRVLTLTLIIIGIPFGIYGIICGSIMSLYLWIPVNVYCSSKLTGYGIFKQITDMTPNFCLSCLVGCIVFCASSFITITNNYVLILLHLSSYLVLYIILAWLFKNEGFAIFYNIANTIILKKFQ